MQRFTQVPITLYRIQARLPVNLRNYDVQMAKKRASYDLKLHSGLVKPVDPSMGFVTPNGMSLRPAGENMLSILKAFKGEPNVYTLGCGIKLPDGLCIYHEHTDHYSMQTTRDITLEDLNKKMTEFMMTLPVQTRQEYLEQLEDLDDQDN